jgi:hypothetical protein
VVTIAPRRYSSPHTFISLPIFVEVFLRRITASHAETD